MKFPSVAFIVINAICAVYSSDVIELTTSNFDQKVKSYSIALIEFYAPWCGHCKALAPEYEKAATILKSSDPPVPLAKVDCTAETDLCSKYGVSGYPTLKIFKGGELAYDYNGERNSDGIVKYMNSKAGPSSKEFDSSNDRLEKVLESGLDPVVVGFFDNADDSTYKTFLSVADVLSEDFKFYHSFDSKLAEKYKLSGSVAIVYPKVLHNKFESNSKAFDGSMSVDNLKVWIPKNIFGLAGVRKSSNTKYFESMRPLVVAYYDVDYERNPKQTNYWRNRVMKVGQQYSKDVSFAISSAKDFSHELDEFGLDSDKAGKVVVAAKDKKNKKYRMDAEFSMKTFEDWLKDFLAGKVEPYLKSEPIPVENPDEYVKTVVAKNFDDIVNDPTKDVLIEFYAPWCGHCKSLAPKYEELAKKLKDESDIVIAKMDATANDVPSPYDVSGFPTLYFAPKKSKNSPKSYNSGREVDDFIKYLAAESTDPLKGFDRSGKAKKSEL